MKVCWFFTAVTSLVLALAQPVQAQEFFAQVGAIPDGDTLWVNPEDGSAPQKLRLQGIDAPEICQSGGVAARDALRQLLANRRVQVIVKYHDAYGRGLARVQVSGQDAGALMVRTGQAWSSRWQRSRGPYAAEEVLARTAKAGIFAEPEPELPRDFRRRHGSCYPSR